MGESTTHAREHVCNRAGDLDAQKPGHAEKESTDAGNRRAPDEHTRVPIAPGIRPHVEGRERLAPEDNEWKDECG